MLVLSRRRGESVVIHDDIEVVVLEITSNKVRLGFVANKDVEVHRREVWVEKKASARQPKANDVPAYHLEEEKP